jgi:high-affinity Fe2+/Pb2+ permease
MSANPTAHTGAKGTRQVPEGAWLFGVAAILIGVNVARYLRHIAVSGFSLVLGFLALLAALGQIWRVDLPLLTRAA